MAAGSDTGLQLFSDAEIAEWTGEHAGVLVARILAASDVDDKGWMMFQTRTADGTLFTVSLLKQQPPL